MASLIRPAAHIDDSYFDESNNQKEMQRGFIGNDLQLTSLVKLFHGFASDTVMTSGRALKKQRRRRMWKKNTLNKF